MEKSASLAKTLTIAAFAIVIALACVFGLAACGEKTRATVWNGDFSGENIGGFYTNNANTYGTVTKNKDGSITMTNVDADVTGEKTSTFTSFGEEDKNYDWVEGGMDVSFTMTVDPETIVDGTHVVWSLGLNEKDDGLYLTELPVFFMGTEDGVKFVYDFTGVDARADLDLSDAATITTAGDYTVTYSFNVNDDDQIEVVVTLKDANGKELYKSNASTFTVINPGIHESKEYTADTVVTQDIVKGLRYLWCVRATVDVTVSAVSIAA